MARKNLGWVRDTLYSNVSTECLLQRVSDRHGKNSNLYSLVVDHLCGRLLGECADWCIIMSLVAVLSMSVTHSLKKTFCRNVRVKSIPDPDQIFPYHLYTNEVIVVVLVWSYSG